jgi:uncharacterized protein with ParB-like and HNH nuclease domain
MINTFSNVKLSEIMSDIDSGRIQLPDFQRGWVWDDSHIRLLIASVMNSYPVGTLMLLDYDKETSRFGYRPFEGCDCSSRAPYSLVLDGQQRLTALYSAIFRRDPVTTKTDKGQATKRFYYLDIQKCVSTPADLEDAVVSVPEEKVVKELFGKTITLDLSAPENEYKERMFPLNLLGKHTMWLLKYNRYHNSDPEVKKEYEIFEKQIIEVIKTYSIPAITLGRETPLGAVCQVFEKVNTSGVTLTVFELVTATFAAKNFNLRENWETRH